jgi:hypothetical protein
MRSCRIGKASENPEAAEGVTATSSSRNERVGRESRVEVQSGGAEGDGVAGEGLAQGGVWDDARPDPPAQRSSASVREAQPGTSPFQEAILSICCRS